MPKAVIFDFGNVICHFNNIVFLEKLSGYTNKSVEELDRLLYRSSDLLLRYETGEVSSSEFLAELRRVCQPSATDEDLISAFTQIFTPNKPIIEMIPLLKQSYKLGLLSNTNQLDFEHGIKPMEIFRLFDSVSLSFEVHFMKPSRGIFEDAQQKLGLAPHECLYIDDIFEYVDAAKDLGFKGIHYVSHDKLVDSLRENGVEFINERT